MQNEKFILGSWFFARRGSTGKQNNHSEKQRMLKLTGFTNLHSMQLKTNKQAFFSNIKQHLGEESLALSEP